MAAIASSAIQLLEYANQSPVYPGAYEPLNAPRHPRPFSIQMAVPAIWTVVRGVAVTDLRLGDSIQALALQDRENGAPAKVCTRGSDAAKSNVSQAIDGRKVIGNGIAPPPLANFSIVRPGRHDVVLSETRQIILPLQFWPILAGRPPPIDFLFS
jgi:hypothetical protein